MGSGSSSKGSSYTSKEVDPEAAATSTVADGDGKQQLVSVNLARECTHVLIFLRV